MEVISVKKEYQWQKRNDLSSSTWKDSLQTQDYMEKGTNYVYGWVEQKQSKDRILSNQAGDAGKRGLSQGLKKKDKIWNRTAW